MKYLETYNLGELKENELKEINGGSLAILACAMTGVAFLGALAYGAGYLYGKMTCD